MIVVIGSTHDDVLYFEKVLYNKREETILNRFQAYIGTYFNQEALVVSGVYGSILAGALLSNILDHYYVDLIISVGKCYSVDKHTKNGDIVISNRIVNANTDFTSVKEISIGEIPGLPKEYSVQTDIIRYLTQSLNKRSYVTSYQAVFLSSDNLSPETRSTLSINRSIFGITDERLVYDYNSYGLCLAASLKDIPFIACKVVENKFDAEYKVDDYLKVLDRYIDLGKSVLSMVGDIGRNDILRGGVGNEYKN